MRRRGWRLLMALGLLAGLVPLLPVGVAMADDAVVGTGTAISCDDTAFNTALAAAQTNGGGTITFNCGGPATIWFLGEKTITTGNSVVIDGADLITLDGGGNFRLFQVNGGASLEVRNITLSNGNGQGGAIRNGDGGSVTITNSTLSSNQNTGGNAGALLNSGSGATMMITDSEFYDNFSSSDGGVIDTNSDTTLTIERSSFYNNEAGDDGGAIELDGGTVTIEDSTFNDNEADSSGGDGGAIDIDGGTVTISGTTFSNNSGDDGGAIEIEDPVITITNSTFSGNYADDDGGAFNTDNSSADVTVDSTTITDNEASDRGSGIFEGGGTIRLLNTIIADNDGDDCDGSFTSLGYNLDSDNTCGLAATGDIPGGTADLGPLQDNGGYTETHLPGGASDALDAGDPGCPAFDQRGLPRPSGAGCDIGSVEAQTASQYPLCVQPGTGQLMSPLNGAGCLPFQGTLVVPDDYPLTFCINPYTGGVHYLGNIACPPGMQAHVVPDDGNLYTCVNAYTTANRRVEEYGACATNEAPNIVPAEAAVPA